MIKFDLAKLERARAIKGWTQNELAKRSKVSAGCVNRIYLGENTTPKTAKKLADALGLKMEEIVMEEWLGRLAKRKKRKAA